jgi:hypoxanthine-guanine phosphoribosyltransferase
LVHDLTRWLAMQVEDIIDTGATLKRVVARLQEAGAASVKVLLCCDSCCGALLGSPAGAAIWSAGLPV